MVFSSGLGQKSLVRSGARRDPFSIATAGPPNDSFALYGEGGTSSEPD